MSPLSRNSRLEVEGGVPPASVASGLTFYILVGLFVWLSVDGIRANAVALDEFGHIPAGLSHWQLGRHYLYRENPPLVRLLTSLPVLLSSPAVDYSRAFEGQRSEWLVGADFIAANRERYPRLFERARCVSLMMAVATGGLIFWWVSIEHGRMAAAVCSSIWLTDPSVLAHSSIATVDIGASAFGCAAAYAFWGFLRAPSRYRALVAGVFLGLAQSSKFSLLVLYPAWLLVFVANRRRRSSDGVSSDVGGETPGWTSLALILLVSVLTLNAVYVFDESGRPLGWFEFRSALLSGLDAGERDHSATGNRFRSWCVGPIPTPLPAQYVLGFDSQKRDEELGLARMSHGRVVHAGRWFSPFETLIYKLPLGSLLLLGCSLPMVLPAKGRQSKGPSVALVSALFLLAMLATQTGLNWPIRYSLPALPLLAVSVAAGVRRLIVRRLGVALIATGMLWNVTALMKARPDYQAYANEIAGVVGGPRRLFLGSDIDWGQDLGRLKTWYDSRPNPLLPLCACYYGVLAPEMLGIETERLPASFLRPGDDRIPPPEHDGSHIFYWAVSSNFISGMPATVTLSDGRREVVIIDKDVVRPERAFAKIGQTLFVFRVSDKSEAGPDGYGFKELRGCLRLATDYERTRLVSP